MMSVSTSVSCQYNLDRFSRNSSSEIIFNGSKRQYEDALRKSAFESKVTYKDSTSPTSKRMICRKRKIIWFCPPYNQNVSTNIAKIFLKLVEKHFPRTHRLPKIFNHNTIKVSYSCVSNVKQLIKKHNNFIQNIKSKTTLSCNSRDNNGCPLNGNCTRENVIDKCTSVTNNNLKKFYLGVSDRELKNNGTTTTNNCFE